MIGVCYMDIIDEAFEFYDINEKYKEQCYICAQDMNNDDKKNAFNKVYNTLYYGDFSEIEKFWDINNINNLFTENIHPFVTNLMIVLGYEIHKNNMKKYNFDANQVQAHKKRVKECFESDLINMGYPSVRISQMLWAIYFIRIKIIEIGRLQYEYFSTIDNTDIVKIHIPKNDKLNIDLVKKSILDSKEILESIYKIKNIKYVCNSWLLSNEIYANVSKNSNISKFHDLFDVEDGDDCVSDILNFVWQIKTCDNYATLQENTTLQKIIKNSLLNGEMFHLGMGTLKLERIYHVCK